MIRAAMSGDASRGYTTALTIGVCLNR